MNLPNVLTVLRMVLIPVFALLYTHDMPHMALCVYVLAALTDALDGFLARRLNQVTSFGKLMDPAADKLMQLTMLICLCSSGHVAWWIPVVLGIKEIYLAIGSMIMLKKQMVVSANFYGKAATCLGIAAIMCLYPWHQITWLTQTGQVLLILSLALSLFSGVVYTIECKKRYEAAH